MTVQIDLVYIGGTKRSNSKQENTAEGVAERFIGQLEGGRGFRSLIGGWTR